MDHEDGAVFLDQEYHLEIPAVFRLSPDKELVIIDTPGIRTPRIADNKFSAFRSHSVKLAFLHISRNPPKLIHSN